MPSSLVAPIWLAPNNLSTRLVTWFSLLYIPYAFLSTSYESLFLLFYSALLLAYVRFEFAGQVTNDEAFFALNMDAVSIGQYSALLTKNIQLPCRRRREQREPVHTERLAARYSARRTTSRRLLR